MSWLLAILASAFALFRATAPRFLCAGVVLVHGAQRVERSCVATRERDEAYARQLVPGGGA